MGELPSPLNCACMHADVHECLRVGVRVMLTLSYTRIRAHARAHARPHARTHTHAHTHRFLANVSHELRTPLNSVIAFNMTSLV